MQRAGAPLAKPQRGEQPVSLFGNSISACGRRSTASPVIEAARRDGKALGYGISWETASEGTQQTCGKVT
jgi:hypothetical protein